VARGLLHPQAAALGPPIYRVSQTCFAHIFAPKPQKRAANMPTGKARYRHRLSPVKEYLETIFGRCEGLLTASEFPGGKLPPLAVSVSCPKSLVRLTPFLALKAKKINVSLEPRISDFVVRNSAERIRSQKPRFLRPLTPESE